MIDLGQRLGELDQLGAPEMRSDIDRRAQELLGSEQAVHPAISPTQTRWRGPLMAVGTAVAVLVVVAAAVLFLRADPGVVTTAAPETTVPAVETAVPLGNVSGLEASAGSLWVWGDDEDDEIWRYTDRAWEAYAAMPHAWDVAYDGDTLWHINESRVFYLDGVDWAELPAPRPAWRLDADPDAGTLWLSSGENLYRWDGEEMSNVGHPPNWLDSGDGEGYVGDIVVTADGDVWAAGLHGYWPSVGGLAHYDTATSKWETVRPLGGDEDVPAGAFATTPNGGLWVILADWFEDWEQRETKGEPTAVWALAHRDGTTGAWTVHDEDLPGGYALAIAADDDAVWLSQGFGGAAGFEELAGIIRFDGETWTNYLEGTPDEDLPVEDIAVAPDGTVWYILNGSLRQLEP